MNRLMMTPPTQTPPSITLDTVLVSIRTRGSLDIRMPMLMVNLDCSDSQAASTLWRQQFFVRDINAAERSQ